MPNSYDLPDKPEAPQTSMLDDILATDEVGKIPGPAPSGQELTVSYETKDRIQPLDLRLLNAGDFSVILCALMSRLGIESVVLTDEERTKASEASPGMVKVLAARIDTESSTLYLDIHETKPSEFRP